MNPIQCPCGQTPQSVRVVKTEDSDDTSFDMVAPSCCSAWRVDSRGLDTPLDETADDFAVRVWNAAPRGRPLPKFQTMPLQLSDFQRQIMHVPIDQPPALVCVCCMREVLECPSDTSCDAGLALRLEALEDELTDKEWRVYQRRRICNLLSIFEPAP